jgi:hypothetical protein
MRKRLLRGGRHCPRLPVWEDASDRRLIVREEIGRELLGRLGGEPERQFLSG